MDPFFRHARTGAGNSTTAVPRPVFADLPARDEAGKAARQPAALAAGGTRVARAQPVDLGLHQLQRLKFDLHCISPPFVFLGTASDLRHCG